MNTELLLKVKAAILAEPESFDMELWFKNSTRSHCGTAACIAGHALTIAKGYENPKAASRDSHSWEQYVEDAAQDSLGLSLLQSDGLFYAGSWPSEFANRYRRAKTARGRARVAAERIDYFIATEGK